MSELFAGLQSIVGGQNVLTQPHDASPFLTDWRGRFTGLARAVVRPKTTGEVSLIMKLAHENGVGVVPQGGNTGLVGGGIPDATGSQILLSLGRMKEIRSIDLSNDSVVIDAGCILSDIQKVAEESNRLFPLSLASEGSCQIGGNIASNAGGLEVVRYGPMRDAVLGLEVVLPNGDVINGLTGLRKNNTGYDLKHLFIGSEGTLGVITGACLKLSPRPTSYATAFVALSTPEDAIALLTAIKETFGSRLSTFEIISELQLGIVMRHAKLASPFDGAHPWYVLVELTEMGPANQLNEELTSKLGDLLDAGRLNDAAIAQSEAQKQQFWSIRHRVSESNVREGRVLSFDTSVPVSATAAFIRAVAALLEPFDAQIAFVGHMGDGNIHAVMIFSAAMLPNEYAKNVGEASKIVYEITAGLDGSISAEHGIGISLRDKLPLFKDPAEMQLMKDIKNLLDPKGIMNPGKLI